MARSVSAIRRDISDAQRKQNLAEEEKRKYNQALTYANKLSSSLKKCDSSLNEAQDNLRRYFTINNKTADGGTVEATKESIEQISRDLDKNIIPHINNQIKNLTSEISSLKSKIIRLRRELESANS